jgi:hypothetical protein
MLTNPEKSNEGNQQMLNAFEILREIQFELKCHHQYLLLQTWMPPEHLMRICKTIDQLEKLRDYLIQSVFQPYDSGLIFTAPKVFMDELGYAMHAHGSFNNGTAPVSKILSALGRMGNVDLGNTSRTFQQLLGRKEGYTKYLDSLKLSLHNRINDCY